ncbi:uncharacterized protein LOC107371802 [Tetranychus urticae]|uniref:uncharacterized protein LOC107371802 n=1 Tax=Tetranychus urticae TaxID=32264 RepID=UPI00077B8BC8|nr:uncharacterized protein LOC107371802 [Tetranychus urticae]
MISRKTSECSTTNSSIGSTISQAGAKTVCFYSHRRLQSALHYCNSIIFLLSILLGIIAYVNYKTYIVNIDSDLIVRYGYIMTSVALCVSTIIGSGSELKSSHFGLVFSSSLHFFAFMLTCLSLIIGIIDTDRLYFSIGSELERSFSRASKNFHQSVAHFNTSIATDQKNPFNSSVTLPPLVARTMREHQCCGWYWPQEFCKASSCPGSCCPETMEGQSSRKWVSGCSNANRFKDVCFDKMILIYKSDLITMHTLAGLIIPLLFASSICTIKLAQYVHEFD